MNSPTFWDDRRNSEQIIGEFNSLVGIRDEVYHLGEDIENFYLEMAINCSSSDVDTIDYLENEALVIGKKIDELEIKVLLNDEYDKNDAVLEIHSGAGGTEACDWTNMLYRMYLRWCEKKGYKVEIIDEISGGEVGIKSISLIVKGYNAYGYLQGEKGIHRLVRISPFDSNSRRHTSFAAVEVTPVIDDTCDIVIDEKDIRVDVYRSSGAGGQGVNTTDSAVRITHLPTKIIVTCQNERSQIQNKEKCMQILKSKLMKMRALEKESEMKALKGEQKEINFGSQIRSYIMCPYTLVKDHRTNAEDVNVSKVLDGDIDKFIKEYLKEKGL